MTYGYTHLQETTRKARKAHMCIWCGVKIEPKHVYMDVRGVMDGRMQADKFHLECRRALVQSDRHLLEEGFEPHENGRGMTMDGEPASV